MLNCALNDEMGLRGTTGKAGGLHNFVVCQRHQPSVRGKEELCKSKGTALFCQLPVLDLPAAGSTTSQPRSRGLRLARPQVQMTLPDDVMGNAMEAI